MSRIKNTIIDCIETIKEKLSSKFKGGLILRKKKYNDSITLTDVADTILPKLDSSNEYIYNIMSKSNYTENSIMDKVFVEERLSDLQFDDCDAFVIDINELVYKFIMSKLRFKSYINQFAKVNKTELNKDIRNVSHIIKLLCQTYCDKRKIIIYPDNIRWNIDSVEKYIYNWKNSDHRISTNDLSNEMRCVDYIKYKFIEAAVFGGATHVMYKEDDKIFMSECIDGDYDGVTNDLVYSKTDSIELGDILMTAKSDTILYNVEHTQPYDLSMYLDDIETDKIKAALKYKYRLVNDYNINLINNGGYKLVRMIFKSGDESYDMYELDIDASADVVLSLIGYISQKLKFLHDYVSCEIQLHSEDDNVTMSI